MNPKYLFNILHLSHSECLNTMPMYLISKGTKANLSLHWRHNGRDSVSNHQPHDCLLNRLFRRRSKKTSKLRVTGLCERNSPLTGDIPAQKASNAETFSLDDVIMFSCWMIQWHYPGMLLQSSGVITRYDITYSNAMTAAEHNSDFKLSKDIPYLALAGELLGVCCEDWG